MADTELSAPLRRTLLLKIISNKEPQPEDVDDIIELTSSKIVELLQAQSMTFYLVQGNKIRFKHVYYSPSLWGDNQAKAKDFAEKEVKLKELELPVGTGIVGKVIERGEPAFFSLSKENTRPMFNMAKDTGFDVNSMVTVPLIGSKCIGAIQVLNKEPDAIHPEFRRDDLKVLEEVAEYTAPLIQRLIDPKYEMPDEKLAMYIAKFTDSHLVLDKAELEIDEKLLEVVGEDIIKKTGVVPTKKLTPTSVAAVMVNPYDYNSREEFERVSELHLEEVMVAPESLINSLLGEYFQSAAAPEMRASDDEEISGLVDVIGAEMESGAEAGGGKDLEDEDSAPIITLANRIVEDAYVLGASDIHVEPQENDLIVRYRIDGVCQEKLRLPKQVAGALSARYKIMSELDIAEKRLPQDGRIVFKKYTKKNIDIDLRVATGPMNFGEKIVMRILDKTKSALPITALGFSEYNLSKYRDCIRQPYGMILHCGPTGSGKSMTLFSALREIATPDINIQTAEDPIEYTIPGINQMQMHKQIGLTFARALRAYLRMDPDIILVGEIRDQETAEIAVEAALTGHLLLSTLHTNDAPSTVARFTDMEIEPFMISASLLVVCAQRLMRRVCKSCKEEYMPEGNELEILKRAMPDWEPHPIFRASEGGCKACGGNGMKGRVGIHELMQNSDELVRAINEGRETADLKRIAMATGMYTLHQDSMLKVTEGVTTILEGVGTVPPDITAADAEIAQKQQEKHHQDEERMKEQEAMDIRKKAQAAEEGAKPKPKTPAEDDEEMAALKKLAESAAASTDEDIMSDMGMSLDDDDLSEEPSPNKSSTSDDDDDLDSFLPKG
ncbi:ATPase, T2SS/T4P/T4SS family [Cerasicoccus fimbriatus]|uniref:ATPase, T2SS/T4P/T4SS family n=1 Tax=Cerasicoccus fimbriatus TaxID=3014554 RepID=UPI0022B4A64B|nr:ATPase, T2SS/T4P/T4SS family [Cerasicoccus sp. TK19100]